MARERDGMPARDAATDRTRRARGLVDSSDELRKGAARARRAEAAIVSSYLRALRRLGDVPIGAARPEMPH